MYLFSSFFHFFQYILGRILMDDQIILNFEEEAERSRVADIGGGGEVGKGWQGKVKGKVGGGG